jgi:hypothetical protein
MKKLEKKFLQNFYVISLLTGYLRGVVTLFRSLKKSFFKNDGKRIKTL